MTYRMFILAAFVCMVLTQRGLVFAFQPPGSSSSFRLERTQAATFQVEVRVLMQPSANYAVKAQEWNRVFQTVGYPVVFDSQIAGKQPGIRNIQLAGRVRVQAVGVMDATGGIHFGKKKFVPSRVEPLIEFLESLKQYGAGGPPEENPSWGLNDEQFKTVLKLLSPAVGHSVNLRTPVDAVESIELAPVFRVRYTEGARKLVLSEIDSGDALAADVGEISQGSALAIVLAQYGLGFRPMADKDGGFIIEIDAGGESDNLWPVGWKNTKKLNSVVPAIFRSMSIGELEKVEVPGLVQVVADHLKLPHYYSSHALHSQGIDVGGLTYSHKAGRVAPSGLMRNLGDKFKMGLGIRTDEAGNVFLWVTTRSEFKAFNDRFSHVVPGGAVSE